MNPFEKRIKASYSFKEADRWFFEPFNYCLTLYISLPNEIMGFHFPDNLHGHNKICLGLSQIPLFTEQTSIRIPLCRHVVPHIINESSENRMRFGKFASAAQKTNSCQNHPFVPGSQSGAFPYSRSALSIPHSSLNPQHYHGIMGNLLSAYWLVLANPRRLHDLTTSQNKDTMVRNAYWYDGVLHLGNIDWISIYPD